MLAMNIYQYLHDACHEHEVGELSKNIVKKYQNPCFFFFVYFSKRAGDACP
jgi:hypothetical protein